jgi:hypothetical protein
MTGRAPSAAGGASRPRFTPVSPLAFIIRRPENSGSDVENLAGRDTPDIVGQFDGSGDFSVSKTDLAGLFDVILDAGYAIARQCGAQGDEFMFPGTQYRSGRLGIP